jgi:glycosyltransferase involved in cell wall biosynthesis
MPTFSIITPSYQNLNWLKLCAASIRDQDVDLQHIVQDSCSRDGTPEWLQQHPEIVGVVEKDRGMYDAVNRGFGRASGEILAYLNCDEQYLPGVLAQVGDYFKRHPEVEMVFADALVVDPYGRYLCERRASLPQALHTLVSNNLSILTAATFFRRSVFADRGLAFDPRLKSVGDAEWVLRLLQAKVRMAVLPLLTSAFTDTGCNMNTRPELQAEKDDLMRRAPAWARVGRSLIVAHYRLRRFFAGHYLPSPPYNYSIYTSSHPDQRQKFSVVKPQFRWERVAVPPPEIVPAPQEVVETPTLAMGARGGLTSGTPEKESPARLAP